MPSRLWCACARRPLASYRRELLTSATDGPILKLVTYHCNGIRGGSAMTRHEGAEAVLDRLLGAVNAHDLDGLVACFADDYLNETPAHPRRGFRGSAQVGTNWRQIFAGAADLHATVP